MHLVRHLALVVAGTALLGGCDSTVVGGGGGVGGGGVGGGSAEVGTAGSTADAGSAGGAEDPASTGATTTTAAGTTSSSTGSGTPTVGEGGVVIPGDGERVRILLGNFTQTCDAPQEDAPCAPGAWWLSTVDMPASYLAPGRYPLNTGEVSIDLHETSDDCSGQGYGGWDGEPAWITIDSVDAEHVVFTIEGAYLDVDGTWDVPLCSGVTPG